MRKIVKEKGFNKIVKDRFPVGNLLIENLLLSRNLISMKKRRKDKVTISLSLLIYLIRDKDLVQITNIMKKQFLYFPT